MNCCKIIGDNNKTMTNERLFMLAAWLETKIFSPKPEGSKCVKSLIYSVKRAYFAPNDENTAAL